MTDITTIFLDDGGVMSDNSRRPAQWQKLLGEFFVPRLGGTLEQWAKANREVMDLIFADRFLKGPSEGQSMAAWERNYGVSWIRGMANHVGVEVPSDDDEVFKLSRAAEEYVIPKTKADFPGAADTIKKLSDGGYRLFTASGSLSYELHHFTTNMGVRDLFKKFYGRDLIRQAKGESRVPWQDLRRLRSGSQRSVGAG